MALIFVVRLSGYDAELVFPCSSLLTENAFRGGVMRREATFVKFAFRLEKHSRREHELKENKHIIKYLRLVLRTFFLSLSLVISLCIKPF